MTTDWDAYIKNMSPTLRPFVFVDTGEIVPQGNDGERPTREMTDAEFRVYLKNRFDSQL